MISTGRSSAENQIISIQDLETQLTDELSALDISANELDEAVRKKQAEVDRLASNEKAKATLAKRRDSLAKLQSLQTLAQKISEKKKALEVKTELKDTKIEFRADDKTAQFSTKSEEKKQEASLIDTFKDTKESTSSVTEKLANLLKRVPPCAERSLDFLINLIELKKNGEKNFTLPGISSADLTSEIKGDFKSSGLINVDLAINNELTVLKDLLRKEELDSHGMVLNWLKESERCIKIESWGEAKRSLNSIIRELRPFNIQEFSELTVKAEQAARKVEGKKVLLLLGGTGAGKSTTIHYLAGTPLKKDESGNIAPSAPDEIKDPDLRNITVGEKVSESQTRYISAVTVEYGIKQEVVIVDTPGFGDTAGPEVDAANGQGIIKALHVCKSVKPLILISNNSIGDRYEGFRLVTSILLSMIPDVITHYKGSISYAFTKFPADAGHMICKRTEKFRLEMTEEKYDQTEMIFIDHLLAKIQPREEGDPSRVKIIDPLGTRKSAINYLFDLVGPESPAAIDYPANAFVPFMTDKSKNAINAQVAKHKFNIMSAVKRKDYQFVKYKLDELKLLNDHLPDFVAIRNALDDCIRYVVDNMNREYGQQSMLLNRCFEDGNMLKVEDIEAYKHYIESASAAKDLRDKYLKKDAVQEESYKQVIIQWLINTLALIEKDLKDESGLDRQQVLNAIAARLDKIKLITKYFPEFNSQYQQAVSITDNWLNKILTIGNEEIRSKKYDFNKIASIFGQLQSGLGIFKDHIDYNKQLNKFNELKDTLVTSLNEIAAYEAESKSELNFERVKYTELDIKHLTSSLQLLEQALASNILHVYIDKSVIQKIYQKLIDSILTKFNTIHNEIVTNFAQERDRLRLAQSPQSGHSKAEEKNNDSFQAIKPLIDELSLIRKIPTIFNLTEVKYLKIVQELYQYVDGIRMDMENKLARLMEQSDDAGYVQFGARLASLKNATWIDSIKPGTCVDAVERIVIVIIENMVKLSKQIHSLDLSLENPQIIQQSLQQLLSQVSSMSILQKDIPELTSYIEDILLSVRTNIETNLDRVRREISLESKTTTYKKSILENLLAYRAQYNKLTESQLFLKNKGYQNVDELDQKIKDKKSAHDNLEPQFKDEKKKLNERYNALHLASGQHEAALSSKDLLKTLASVVSGASREGEAKAILKAVGHDSLETVFQEMLKIKQDIQQVENKLVQTMNYSAKELSDLVALRQTYEKLVQSKDESSEQRKFLESKDVFSITELDERIQRLQADIAAQESYEFLFDKLELNKMETCRAYLEACKSLKTFNKVTFEKISSEMLEVLANHIKHYLAFLNKKLTESFKKIIGTTTEVVKGPTPMEVFYERIVECTSLCKQISDNKSKYSAGIWGALESGCKSLLSQWGINLYNYHDQLAKLMSRQKTANQFDDLESSLNVARKLAQLDSYFVGGQFSFNKLYKDNSDAIVTGKSKIQDAAIKYIASRDYQKVQEIMEVYRKSWSDSASVYAFEQIQKELAYCITDMTDRTIRAVKSLDLDSENTASTKDKFEQVIATNLDALKKASRSVQDYLPGIIINSSNLTVERKGESKGASSIAKSKNGIVQNIESLITEQMLRFLETLKESIAIYNFKSVGTKINFIETILSKVLELDNAESEIVRNKINELNKAIDNKLNDLIAKYKGKDAKDALPIEKYSQFPLKDVFQKLELAAKSNLRGRYQEILDTLTYAVKDKFRNEFELLKNTPSDQQTKRRRELERSLQSLPEDIARSLKQEFDNAVADIDKDVKELEEKINSAIRQYEPKVLAKMYEDVKDLKQKSNLQEGILKNIHDYKASIDTKLKQSNINVDELRKDLKKFIEYKDLFGESKDKDIKDSVDGAYIYVQDKFTRLFEYAYKAMESAINGTEPDVTLSAKTAEDSFDIITACMELRGIDLEVSYPELTPQLSLQLTSPLEFKRTPQKQQKDKNNHRGDSKHGVSERNQQATLFPSDLEEKVKSISDKLVMHFAENQKHFNASIITYNLVELRNALQIKRRWNGLFIRVKSKHITLSEASAKQLQECNNYDHDRRLVSETILNLIEKICGLNLVENEQTKIHKDREAFYKDLSTKVNFLKSSRELKDYADASTVDVTQVEQKYTEALKSQAELLHKHATHLIEILISGRSLSITQFNEFNNCYENLVTFQQYLPYVAIADVQKYKNSVKASFDGIINGIEKKLTGNNTIDPKFWKAEDVCQCLINLKYLANNVLSFKAVIDAKIDEIVDRYEKNQEGVLAGLGTLLNQDKNGTGQMIMAEHGRFKGCLIDLYNRKTQAQTIEYVLDNMDGTDCTTRSKDSLHRFYNEFKNKYSEIIQQNLNTKIEFTRITNELNHLIGSCKPQSSSFEHKGDSKGHEQKRNQSTNTISWNSTVKARIPHLVAYIFAYWTLNNAKHYFDAGKSRSFLLTPHPAQVISIFRMLGIGERTDELINNLVQIGTGEGKSVTLAVTACVLTLLGFDVSCACYSDYLSKRDFNEFKSLFDTLGVSDHVRYGTFNQLCEYVLNENGSIREKVENLILKDSKAETKETKSSESKAEIKSAVVKSKRPKILLIDEVDVFFSQNFYGKIYTPSASISDPNIFKLAKYIWSVRNKNVIGSDGVVHNQHLTLRHIKNTQEYADCISRFKKWEFLVIEAVKDMIAAVSDLSASINNPKGYVPDYIVNSDRIMYKDNNDTYSANVVMGYQTIFSYFHEHEAGKISEKSLQENASILIRCGSFSYAEIPHMFAKIMGVSGTLRSLSDPEKNIIETVYKINRQTFIPSVFGATKISPLEEKDVRVVSKDDYFGVIAQDIMAKLKGRLDTKRAVIGFFDTRNNLQQFYNSHAFATLKSSGSVNILTEELNEDERNQKIKRATASGQITLCTRSFGRGTDFTCHDETVISNGGVHVGQYFLSMQHSEEVQTRGRTARQGNPGTFNLIICEDSRLESLKVTKEDLEAIKSGEAKAYKTLHERRNAAFAFQYMSNDKFVKDAKVEHDLGNKLIESINSNDEAYIRKFLGERNKGAAEKPKSRTILLMDATGSMYELLQSTKNTVETMFSRATKVLAEHKDASGKPIIEPNAFKMQFAVYRNYNCSQETILQHSKWTDKAEDLREFMNGIDTLGGLGNEAIEIGLWHANREAATGLVTQVILIGDMPANTEEEVKKHRSTKFNQIRGVFGLTGGTGGEAYWSKSQFSKPTFYLDEVKELARRNIPVNTFYIDEDGQEEAKENFAEIARKTGGKTTKLDVYSPEGADILTDLVTEALLKDIDEEKGDTLVAKYRKMFGTRSYRS